MQSRAGGQSGVQRPRRRHCHTDGLESSTTHSAEEGALGERGGGQAREAVRGGAQARAGRVAAARAARVQRGQQRRGAQRRRPRQQLGRQPCA